MSEKNNISKFTGILFELKIGLNKDNAIVIDYGGKPVGKIREALEKTNVDDKILDAYQDAKESGLIDKIKCYIK